MNRKQIIAIAALTVVSGTAFAQGTLGLQHFGESQASVATREAVRNEFLQSRAKGNAPVHAEVDVANLFQKAPASGLTRADVRAEVLKARADGSLDRLAEVELFESAPVASVRTREEVKAEALAYTRSRPAARVQAGH